MKNLLLIEDSADIVDLVTELFPEFLVNVASSCADAKKLLSEKTFDVAIIDIELPDGNGLLLYSEMKSDPRFSFPRSIFLSAHSALPNKIMAFSLGSEDFMSKPFEPLELRARVLRFTQHAPQQAQDKKSLSVGELKIDLGSQRVWVESGGTSRQVELTLKEFKLLTALASCYDRIQSRQSLLSLIWGEQTQVVDRTIDTHISRLRRKLDLKNLEIESIAGEGYRLTQASNIRKN
jgi:DNA-binding response OmpR family regulator